MHVFDIGRLLPEHADHLFDLYYPAPAPPSERPLPGSGCSSVATHQRAGGTILARSRPEGGAEFGFELPIYEPEDEVIPSDVAEPGAPGVAAVS